MKNDEDAAAEAIASLTSPNSNDAEDNNGETTGSKPPSVDPAAVEPTDALSTSTNDNAAAQEAARRKYKKRVKDPDHKFPLQPRVIQVVHKPKRFVNHSYRDFSSMPPDPDYSPPKIDDMSFAEKLHHMLSDKEFETLISWMPHGRAFKVLRPSEFERRVMPTYFGHSRYSSFLSMIRQHGLKSLTKAGPDQGCLYHEFLIRGLPHLTKYMPLPRNPRRLEDDIDNEPDLYAITNLYPVPLGHAVPNATVQPLAPVVVSNDQLQLQQQQQQQLQLQQQQQQQQQQMQQQQVFMAAAQPIQQPTFIAPGMQPFAPAGMIAGYPQPQFFFAAAPPAAYATAAAPQFLTTYPGAAAVGSYPMMAATAPAQFAPATTTTPMFSHPFIIANPAPVPSATTTTPTFINTSNLGQPVFNFAPGVIATTPTAAPPTATTTSS